MEHSSARLSRGGVRRITALCAILASVAVAVTTFGSRAAAEPALAFFHINLVSSVPAKDSHVMTAPREIRLTFSGTVDVTKASVQLLDASGKAVEVEPLRAVPDSARVAVSRVKGDLVGGTHTVRWQAIAADGAQGGGSFQFMYMPSGSH